MSCLLGVALLTAACAAPGPEGPGPAFDTATPAVPPPASTPPDSPPGAVVGPGLSGAGTAAVEVDRDGAGSMGYLTGVRLARQDGFDRIVLQFADRVPGYLVRYQDLPVLADGSGAVIPTPGATTSVLITVRPASGYQMDTSTPTYTGPRTITADTTRAVQAVAAGDFEAVLNWAVGLRGRTPFRVTELTAPPRLVVDFQH